MVKNKGRQCETYGKYLGFSWDFYTAVKKDLEKLNGETKTTKERHTLRRRIVEYIPLGEVRRRALEFTGLEGKIKDNHSFQSTKFEGNINVRWLPCSCRVCFLGETGQCAKQIFNLAVEKNPINVLNAKVDTKKLDDHLNERHAKHKRHLEKMTGGCEGILVAFQSDDPSEPYYLASLAGPRRKRVKTDAFADKNGQMVECGSKSKHVKDEVIEAFVYESAKRPRLNAGASASASTSPGSLDSRLTYEVPPTEKCKDVIFRCKARHCKKRHRHLFYFNSIRPPFIPAHALQPVSKDDGNLILGPREHQRILEELEELEQLQKGTVERALL